MSNNPLWLLGIAGPMSETTPPTLLSTLQMSQLERSNAALQMALQQSQYEMNTRHARCASQSTLNALHNEYEARAQRMMSAVRTPPVSVQVTRPAQALSMRLRLARRVMRLTWAVMRCYAKVRYAI